VVHIVVEVISIVQITRSDDECGTHIWFKDGTGL